VLLGRRRALLELFQPRFGVPQALGHIRGASLGLDRTLLGPAPPPP
jgi:hypothetical protein